MNNSWQITQLGEIVHSISRPERVDTNKEYKLLGVRLEGKGPFLREIKTGYDLSAKTLFQVKSGDFIYSRLFAWRGAFGIISNELDGCYVSNEFPVFQINSDKLDIRFLLYWFRLPETIRQVEVDCTGSTPLTRNRFKEKFFLALDLPIPPLSEQQRIVAKIEQLAVKVEEAQTLQDQTTEALQTLVDSEIRRIFTSQNTVTWQQGCLGDYVIDDCYGTSEKCYDEPIGSPILRMGNIQEGCLEISDLKYLEITEKDRQKWILKKGDIVVNRTNSAELVGKCAVFDLEGEYGFASYLIRLCLDTTKADPYLVAMYINSPIGREYMFRERKQMTGQANVNAKKLKALPIKLPALSEQKRIVAYLDSLQAKAESLKRLQAQTQTELDALLPSILDKAFKGELQ